MQGLVNIQVRVEAKQARAALRGVTNELRELQRVGSRTAAVGGGFKQIGNEAEQATKQFSKFTGRVKAGVAAMRTFGSWLRSGAQNLVKWGKNLQWTGRQLEFRFTLPILAAAAAGTKWALAQDKAMTRVRKVYGDGSESAAQVAEDLALLEKAFFMISNRMGIHVEEVTEIAALWAQAGAEGASLAKAVSLTTEAMVLGDLGAAEAVEGLITVAAAYQLSAEELAAAVHTLNVIENELPVSLGELIEVIQDAGGVARVAGTDIRELAAMTSALVPAAGSASEAGNSLKSIIARIVSPTKQASRAFEALGINLEGDAWRSATFTQKMEQLVEGYRDLDQAQKLNFARNVGQIRQISRLAILLEDMIDENGRYQKAMDATSDSIKNQAVFRRELETLLASDSRTFDILTNQLRNLLTQVMLPLLPVINSVVNEIVQLVHAFRDLSPETQKIIGLGVVFIALVGPLAALTGSFGILIGSLFDFIFAAGKAIGVILKFTVVKALIPILAGVAKGVAAVAMAFFGWPAVIALVIAALALLITKLDAWDDITEWIGDRWNDLMGMLPESVANGINAVVQVFGRGLRAVAETIRSWITVIWDLLSYLNPFARHSPSLVEQVQRGTREIVNRYRDLSAIRSTLTSLAADFRKFASVVEGTLARVAGAARDLEYLEIEEVLGPDAANAVRGLDEILDSLEQQLEDTAVLYIEQEKVVKEWELALNEAELAVDSANDALDEMKSRLSDLETELSASEARLSAWASATIAGTHAWQDAIFDNAMAQKSLQLEILLMEQAMEDAGIDIQAVRDYIAEQADAVDDAADAAANAVDATQDLTQAFNETGMSADDIRNRMALLRGEIEGLRAKSLDLRLAGAGSDVLAGLSAQIDNAEAARRNLAAGLARAIVDEGPDGDDPKYVPSDDIIQQVKDLDDLRAAYERLRQEGEILQLRMDLDLEPQLKIIDDIMRGPEFTLDEIIAGIAEERANIARLESEISNVNAEIAEQEQLIANLEDDRNRILATYEAEVEKLDEIEQQYRDIEATMRDIESARSDIVSAAATQKQVEEEAAARAGGGSGSDDILGSGDFPVPGGAGFLEGFDDGDLQSLLDQWQEEWARTFDDIDPFGPIKDAWNDFQAWWGGIEQWFRDAWQRYQDIFKVDYDALFKPFGDAWEGLSEWVGGIWDDLTGNFEFFGTDFSDITDGIMKEVGDIWEHGWELIRTAFGVLSTGIEIDYEGFLGNLFDFFVSWWEGFQRSWSEAWNLLGPALEMAWTSIQLIIEGFLTIIDGLIQVAMGLMTLSWTDFWNGIRDIAIGFVQIVVGAVGLTWSSVQAAAAAAWVLIGDAVRKGWGGIVSGFSEMKSKLGRAWEDTWRSLRTTFDRVWGGIKSAVASKVNGMIFVLNSLIGAAEWAINHIPFVNDVNLPRIGYVNAGGGGGGGGGGAVDPDATGAYARGGRIGGGFMTSGAMAIVGEGRRAYPEYVIPTDPAYRGRAVDLARSLLSDLNLPGMAKGGMLGIPRLALGGILGSLGSGPKKVGDKLWNFANDMWDKLSTAKRSIGDGIVPKLGKTIAHSFTDAVVKLLKNSARRMWDVAKMAVPVFSGLESVWDILPWGAEGGIARATPGGMAVRVAEAGMDEALVPLPAGTRARMAAAATEPIEKNINFYGDLSFPNITDAGDAEEFIRNLEALANT